MSTGRRDILAALGEPQEAATRAVAPAATEDERTVEATLRPRSLDEFVGQPELREHLRIVLDAARARNQTVDHLLFAGPPGLGKTSLAGIVAAELGLSLIHI